MTGYFENLRLSLRSMKRRDPNMITFIVYGLLYDLFINLYKPFATKFLQRLDGGAFHISLYNSLPGIFAVCALIPGALLINRFRNKKRVTAVLFGASRMFVLALVFVPFFAAGIRPMLFVVLIAAMNFPDAVSQASLQSYLGDVFDGRSRYQVISLRNKFGQIAVPVVTLITGLIITVVPKTNEQAIIVYQIFFALAVAVGLIEIITFLGFKEKQRVDDVLNDDAKPGLSAVFDTLKDKRFVSYLLPTIIGYFFIHAAWPLFGVLQVIDMKATEIQIAFVAVISGISGFAGATIWPKMIAKKGNDFATALAVLLMGGCVFLAVISPNMYVYVATQIYAGAVGVGINITFLNGLLMATPDKNRVVYIAVYNTFVNISLGVSPFFANALYNAFGTRAAMGLIGVGRTAAGAAMFLLLLHHNKKKKVTG